MCKYFFSSSSGEARSINENDIDNFRTGNEKYIDYSEFHDEFEKICHYQNVNYPMLYAEEKGSGINSEKTKNDGIGACDSVPINLKMPTEQSTNEASTVTVTQTFEGAIKVDSDGFGDKKELIGRPGCYWVASRFVNSKEDYCVTFGIKHVGIGIYGGNSLYYYFNNWKDYQKNYGLRIRPIVHINPNVEIVKTNIIHNEPTDTDGVSKF